MLYHETKSRFSEAWHLKGNLQAEKVFWGASLFGILDLDGATQRKVESEEKGGGKTPVRLCRPSGDGL